MENKNQKGPKAVDCAPGTIAWCTCSLSKNHPYCDGSHKGTEHKPHIHIVGAETTVYLCACGQSHNKPYCDGSHIGAE